MHGRGVPAYTLIAVSFRHGRGSRVQNSIRCSLRVSRNVDFDAVVHHIQGGPKMAPFLYALTLPNINRFSQLFYCQNQKKICNNTITSPS